PGSGTTHCHVAEVTGLAATSQLDQVGSAVSNVCSVSTSGAPAQPNEWIGAFFYNSTSSEAVVSPGFGYAAVEFSNDVNASDVSFSETAIGSNGLQTASCGENDGSELSQLITTFRTANGGAPSISSLSPTQGGPDQLSYITINGNNFGSS